MNSLFRRKASDPRRETWLGDILLSGPVSFHFLAWLLFFTAAALLMYLACGEYTRKERVGGWLMSDHLLTIQIQHSGTVSEVRVQPGAPVRRDQLLAIVAGARERVFNVRAPEDGVVTDVRVEPGDTIAARAILLQILPAGASLEVRLLVPGRLAGLVEKGMLTQLRYPALPRSESGSWRGTVLRVGRSGQLSSGAGAREKGAGAPFFTVQVAPENRPLLSRLIGMPVEADIWLERRSLLEWLLDPLPLPEGWS